MNSTLSQKWLLILAFGIFNLAWLLPNHYLPWVVAYQEFAVFFAGLLLVTVMLLSGRMKLSLAIIGFFLMSAIPLLQLWVGVIYFAGDAWVTFFYLIGFALMLQVGYNLTAPAGERHHLVQLLAAAFIVGAVLSQWIAMRQWLMLPGSIWVADLRFGGRPFANLAQPNNLATLLCMGLAGVLYFYEKQLLSRMVAAVLVGFLLFGVALTQSRTPWAGALSVVVFWGWKSAFHKSRLTVRQILGCLTIYSCYVVALPYVANWLALSSSDAMRAGSLTERLSIWMQLFSSIWHGPLWGYGWGQVNVAQVENSLSYPAALISAHSHNILLDMLVWNGPLLGVLIILGVGGWLFKLCRFAQDSESKFALVAAGFVLVHSLLEYPLEYAFFLFPLGLLLGIVAAERPAKALEVGMPRWLLSIILALFIGVYGWAWREYRIIDEDFRLMRFELARVGKLKAEQSAPDVFLLSQLREFIYFVRTPPVVNMNQEQLDRMRRVVYRFPNFSGFLRYAIALGINGQPDAAREQLLIFRNIYGGHNYGQALVELNAMREQFPQLAAVFNE